MRGGSQVLKSSLFLPQTFIQTLVGELAVNALLGMILRLRKVNFLGLYLASVTDLKRIELHTVYAVIFGGYKTEATQARWSGCRPLQVIWQSLQRLFQKVNKGLEGKINSQALGAALLLCLRGSDGRAQTQGVSESAAVAAGRDRLA